MLKSLKRLWVSEAGMETVEWAVLAALIVAGLIAIIASVGTNVTSAFQKIQTATSVSST